MLIVASIGLYALHVQDESSWNIIGIFFVIVLPFLLYGKYPKKEEKKNKYRVFTVEKRCFKLAIFKSSYYFYSSIHLAGFLPIRDQHF